jgi:hypothetical protein
VPEAAVKKKEIPPPLIIVTAHTHDAPAAETTRRNTHATRARVFAARATTFHFMESYTAPVLDVESPTLGEDMRKQLEANGIALVRVYGANHATLRVYQRNMDTIMSRVRCDGDGNVGTAHGSKGMGGITKRYGGACTQEAWAIRLDPRVKDCFSVLYEGKALSIGCDAYTALGDDAKRGSAGGRKACVTAEERYFQLTGGSLQPHVDIHPTNLASPGNKVLERLRAISPGFPVSIQGQLVLRPIPKGGATFVAAPGAHQNSDPAHFDSNAKRDFATCTSAGYAHFEGKWRAVDDLDAGVLILWDSRLPHGNKLADAGVDPQRRGMFICWQPAALVDDTERPALKKRKWDAIINGGTTDHWAGYVPGGNKGHRGSHYSNGKQLSKVVHNDNNPVELDPDIAERVYAAL